MISLSIIAVLVSSRMPPVCMVGSPATIMCSAPNAPIRCVVRLPQAPPTRTTISFEHGSSPELLELTFDPLATGRLSIPVLLLDSDYRVSLSAEPLRNPTNVTQNLAWKAETKQLKGIKMEIEATGQPDAGIEIKIECKPLAYVSSRISTVPVLQSTSPGNRSAFDAAAPYLDDLFSTIAEVAVERATSRAIRIAEARLKELLDKPALQIPHTKALLQNLRLVDLAASARPLVEALTMDLAALAGTRAGLKEPATAAALKEGVVAAVRGDPLVSQAQAARALFQAVLEANGQGADEECRKMVGTALSDCSAGAPCDPIVVHRYIKTACKDNQAAMAITLLAAQSVRGLLPPRRQLSIAVQLFVALNKPKDDERAKDAARAIDEVLAGRPATALVGLLPSTDRKLLRTLTALASYAESYQGQEKDEGARREARKEAVRSILEELGDREERYDSAIVGITVTPGFLVAHAVGGASTARGVVLYQLSLPLGISVTRFPVSKASANLNLGLHAALFVLDLGQYVGVAVPQSSDVQVASARLESSIAVGAQAALVFGSPANPVVVGLDVRWAPTRLTREPGVQPQKERSDVVSVGFTVGYLVPLFDLN